MSYEGYEQLLCVEGHYWVEDHLHLTYNVISCADLRCPHCNGAVAWFNSVNETNGCEAWDPKTQQQTEIHPDHSNCQCGLVQLEMLGEVNWCICPTCKVKHLAEPIRYKIPENRGKRL